MMSSALDKYAYRAIKYAPSEQAMKYKLAIKETEDYINLAKSGQLDQSSHDLSGKNKTGCYIATAQRDARGGRATPFDCPFRTDPRPASNAGVRITVHLDFDALEGCAIAGEGDGVVVAGLPLVAAAV